MKDEETECRVTRPSSANMKARQDAARDKSAERLARDMEELRGESAELHRLQQAVVEAAKAFYATDIGHGYINEILIDEAVDLTDALDALIEFESTQQKGE